MINTDKIVSTLKPLLDSLDEVRPASPDIDYTAMRNYIPTAALITSINELTTALCADTKAIEEQSAVMSASLALISNGVIKLNEQTRLNTAALVVALNALTVATVNNK